MSFAAGRSDAPAALSTAIAAARADGRGSVHVVTGAPGSGRTTCLADARAIAAAARVPVWSATGHVAERPDDGSLLGDLLGDRLAPEIPAPRRLIAAVEAFGAPLLITLDDADDVDETSFAAVAHLARRIDRVPVVLVVATAAVGPDDPFGALVDETTATVTTLGPLDAVRAAEQVRRVAGSDVGAELVRSCVEASGGNPLLLTALATDAARPDRLRPGGGVRSPGAATEPPVPDAIVRFVARHVRAAGPEAQSLAAAAAVLAATGSPLAAAPAVADLDAAATLTATARLEALGFLAPVGPPRLRPPVVERAVLARLTSARARALHARAADVVPRFWADDLSVAIHLRAARTPVDADQSRTLRSAAATALAAGAPATAVGLLQHADGADLPANEHATVRGLLARAAVADGDLDLARSVVDGERGAGPTENGRRRAIAGASHALLALHRGELADAERSARDALERLPDADVTVIADVRDALVVILVARGRLTEAARTAAVPPRRVSRSDAAPRDLPGPDAVPPNPVALAILRLAQERASDAVELLDAQTVRRADPLVPDAGVLRASALLAAGQTSAATLEAREAMGRIAARRGGPVAQGTAARVLGLCLPGPSGLQPLTDAVDLLRPTEAALELTRALLDLGSGLRRNRRRADARPFLREALERAEAAGADPLVERARDELAATGRRVRRGAALERDELTPSEHRVAALAASGQTNRQIARALFVTTKTVEMHLSSAYRKLGIAARHQLPSELALAAGEPVAASSGAPPTGDAAVPGSESADRGTPPA